MRARITTPPLEWLKTTRGLFSQRRENRLIEDLWFGIEGPNGPNWLIIRAGFVTDNMSVFFPFSLIIKPDSVNPAAPVVHDYLYLHSGILPVYQLDPVTGEPHPVPHNGFTRKQADDMFRTILIETGTPRAKADLLHRAVRIGGGPAWGS